MPNMDNKSIQNLEELGFACDNNPNQPNKFRKQIECLDAKAEMICESSPYAYSRKDYYLTVSLKILKLNMYVSDWTDTKIETIECVYSFYSFITHLIYYLFDEVFSRNFVFRKRETSANMIEFDVVYANSEAQEFVILYDIVSKEIKCFIYRSALYNFSNAVSINYYDVSERDHNILAQEKVKDIHKMIIKSISE